MVVGTCKASNYGLYGHPTVEYHRVLSPDTIVEHRYLPGVPLVVVSGPYKGTSGDIYIVKISGGEEVRVLMKNLIL